MSADHNHWLYNAGTGMYNAIKKRKMTAPPARPMSLMCCNRYTGVLSADNVVVFAPHAEFLNSSNTEIVQIDMTGFGTAYVFGETTSAMWVRSAVDKPLVLLRAKGNPTAFPSNRGALSSKSSIRYRIHTGWRDLAFYF